jgi:hypothetical protein
MTKSVFIDSGAFIALANKRDQFHEIAIKKFDLLLKSAALFYTTSFVFSETVTRVARCASVENAIEIGNVIRSDTRVTVVNPAESEIDEAWEIFRKYKDQHFSFVDCISFAVMHRMNMQKAFAFDEHFR